MGEIKKLPQSVIEKIAAGEVVERPASVVKELVENSIDAGAKEIEITIRKGGKKLISVRDDGIGIRHDDIDMAFERYATSKIYSVDDLYSVVTMGFRGEALAAIASVSRIEIITRHAEESEGTYAYVENAQVVEKKGIGSPVGTTIKVMDLFYNLPPRLKFISNERKETNAIVDTVMAIALGHPEIRFRLIVDGDLMLSTPGDGDLRNTILSLFGREIASHVIPLSIQDNGSVKKIWGSIGDTTIKRATKRFIYTYVNRRFVKSGEMLEAIRDAYGNLIPKGYYPFAVVFMDIDPRVIDVNVHPSKIEVRFRHPEEVRETIMRAITEALKAVPLVVEKKKVKSKPLVDIVETQVKEEKKSPTMPTGGLAVQESLESYGISSRDGVHAIGRFRGMKATAEKGSPLPEMRILGQVGNTYIVCESPEGLVLIDQHALHERIMYQTLKESTDRLKKNTQKLIEPITVELPEVWKNRIIASADRLRDMGIDVVPCERGVEILSFPVVMDWYPSMDEIMDIISSVATDTILPEELDIEERILRLMACKSAIKANTPLSMEQMEDLLSQARRIPTPYACAHGRPTMILIPLDYIGRMFERS